MLTVSDPAEYTNKWNDSALFNAEIVRYLATRSSQILYGRIVKSLARRHLTFHSYDAEYGGFMAFITTLP